MIFDLLHIVLFSVAFILLLSFIFILVRLRTTEKRVQKKLNKLKSKFDDEKSYFEKEIKRQSYVIDEYKRKNGFKVSSIDTEVADAVIQQAKEGGAVQGNVSSQVSIADELEFKEKNKKLWELSIAVHKEKERINKIRKEIEHRHNEVTKSITYAHRIQKALLPTSKFLGIRYRDYFIYWNPRDIVSGDFYWLKRYKDKTIIVVADCTGHGVPGAFMSVLGISFLDEITTKDADLKSNEILDRLREMIKLALHHSSKQRKASDGMDMVLCIIDNNTLEMDYTGANNPVYHIRDGELEVLKENRNPVGLHRMEKPFENQIVQLQKGDKLYMFSDGYIDQFGGEKGRKFLKKNFQRLLLHLANQDFDMEQEKQILDETFQSWKGEKHPQIDDVLVLGLKI